MLHVLCEVTASPNTVIDTGFGLGSMIAVVCSWERNRSILWAILAAIFSWFYVIYFALTRIAGWNAGATTGFCGRFVRALSGDF
jgi:hypothetical protein